jgi:hypothetical protein
MMRQLLAGVFDEEGRRVTFFGMTGGTVAGSIQVWVGVLVGLLTAAYIGVKLYKQIRDWESPDKE